MISWYEAKARMEQAIGAPLSEPQVNALRAYGEGYSLLLAGKAGTGKTWFFKALQIARLSCCEIYDITEESKQCVDWILQDQREYYNDREIVIDDIGRESPKIEYGERTNVLDLIMSYREKHCPNVRTHFVTNLTKAELAARYGDRVLSRMRYCKPIPFLDEDKRQAKRYNVHPFCTVELTEPPPEVIAKICEETEAESGKNDQAPGASEKNENPEDLPF